MLYNNSDDWKTERFEDELIISFSKFNAWRRVVSLYTFRACDSHKARVLLASV